MEQFSSISLEQKWRTAILSSPPRWTRGNPKSYINSLTIPKPPTDKPYSYRVMKGDEDLGIRPTYERDPDGSQRVNLLEYHRGYGIPDRIRIQVYAVDEVGSTEMIAEWPGNN
ncbi:fungal immunomodulatory protein [Mycena albidolilacea]|uniref:Fungal immunomodulatory protein n=1 Tax=Mycena albidolilacea TaxID=1033008 RepID=A0AAD7AJM7_9AGAR|nr:fungal immunomodulatory protein [Mycena albidolilacea]